MTTKLFKAILPCVDAEGYVHRFGVNFYASSLEEAESIAEMMGAEDVSDFTGWVRVSKLSRVSSLFGYEYRNGRIKQVDNLPLKRNPPHPKERL